MKVYIYLIIVFLFIGNKSFSQEELYNHSDSVSNSNIFKKAPILISLNIATNLSIGIFKWDWGSSRFAFKKEGFFGANTANGGADKTGHLWTSYMLSNVNMHFLKKSGVKNYKEYGVLLAWTNMLVIELGDGISKTYGFSLEDLLFNTLGSGVSYLRAQNEFAKELIDIRLEFTPSEFSFEAFNETNYSDLKYILALKPAAFTKSYLKYLEFHIGYYSRGYRGVRASDYLTQNRTSYIGLSVNLHSLIFNKYQKNKIVKYTGDILHSVQIPYTYIPINIFHSETPK